MFKIIRLSAFLTRVPLQEKLPLLEHLHNEVGDLYGNNREQRHGAGKIRAVLAGVGQRVSAKRVSPIIQELGLQSVCTDAKKFYIKFRSSKSEI